MKTVFKSFIYLFIFGVAIFIGVKDVKADKISIDEINITGLTQPKVGDSIDANQASIEEEEITIISKGWHPTCSFDPEDTPTTFTKCEGEDTDWTYTLEIEPQEGYEFNRPVLDINNSDYDLTSGTRIKYNNDDIYHLGFQSNRPNYFIFSSDGETGAQSITISLGFKCVTEYTYKVLEGGNPTYTIGKGKTKQVSIRIDGDYSLLDKVVIDGKELKKDVDYTVREGSTIITLTDKYLSTLKSGNHQIEVRYSNQQLVRTVLKVEATNPSTFDGISVSIALLGVSLLGLSLCVRKLKLRED